MPLFKSNKQQEWSFEQGVVDALVNNLEEGVVVYDPDFKIISFNKAAEGIFEIKSSEVIGKVFSLDKARSFKSKIMAQAMFPSLAPTVVRQSEPGSYPQILDVSLDDPQKELRIITSQVTDNSGRTRGFVKLVKDRTREQELLGAKSDFVAIAAHQLRTPTTGLTWALDSLTKEKLSQSGQETLDIARKTANNLLKIINDLVNVAQIEEGKFGYDFKKIKLVSFLEEILADAEVVAQEYQVKLYFERPADKNLQVMADKGRLGLAISNLLDNAIKYNVENGQVIVKVVKRSKEPEIEVTVKDTGVGIPSKDIPNLFNKFFRSNNVEQFAVGGSGLGLYLAKNIINRHGGEIWAESVVNRGSTFHFTLPLAK